MNISKVEVKLSGEDLLSIINDFVKVEGLNLKTIEIGKGIKVQGEVKQFITIGFTAELQIIGVEEGKLHCKFSSFKLMKLGFLRIFRSLALKLGLKTLEEFGITSFKDEVMIDINKILKNVPMVRFDLKDAYIKEEAVAVVVENIRLSLNGKPIEGIEDEEGEKEEVEILTEEEKVQLALIQATEKVQDGYTIGREVVAAKLPEKALQFKDYIFILPDIIALIYRLLKDNRVPFKTKIIISAAIAYVTVPTNIIPDKIPFIGKIDDLAVAFFALNKIVQDVPLEIIMENYPGKNELVLVLKTGLEYLVNFTGAKNVEKLCSVVSELKTL